MGAEIPTVIGALEKKTGGNGNQKKNRDHPNLSIVEIGQNTEKIPGNLKRLVVTETPMKDNLFMLE